MTDDGESFCATEGGNGSALEHLRELAEATERDRIQREAIERWLHLLDAVDRGDMELSRAVSELQRVGRELSDVMGW